MPRPTLVAHDKTYGYGLNPGLADKGWRGADLPVFGPLERVTASALELAVRGWGESGPLSRQPEVQHLSSTPGTRLKVY